VVRAPRLATAPIEGWRPPTVDPLELPNPAERGAFAVETFTYGSGGDRRRPEFGAQASWTAASVDGSKRIDGWNGPAGWARTRYFGFDATALPLQARAWAPAGPGPFPPILIVHGNYEMTEFSDAGYRYLGELLASRGFITASVDENFLNSGLSDFLEGPTGDLEDERDARGWLLLEHLRAWRAWNADPSHPFRGRVDLGRVALIGHSRGGQAVAEAAVFNRLRNHPDDATFEFDYGFGLRGVIAIAPPDTPYHPRNRRTLVRDVSYLVIQGSHDGDVYSFSGSATYARTRFERCGTCLKAAIYLLGANHGQFNTVWGRRDMPTPWAQFLNLHSIMDPLDQRQVLQVLAGAFLEVVLEGHDAYRVLLRDPARGRAWLGDARLLSQYRDARELSIANYEEDEDVRSGSLPGVEIDAGGLTLWAEREVELKEHDLDSAAAIVGWESSGDPPAWYRIGWPPGCAPRDGAELALALAMSDRSPLRDRDAPWAPPDEIDFSLVLHDAAGRSARIPLSSRQPLFPQVDVHTRKEPLPRDVETREPVFHRYAFPLRAFGAANPELDRGTLTGLTLEFDRTRAGAIFLDDVVVAEGGPGCAPSALE
jgi:dienelactone hydrolase